MPGPPVLRVHLPWPRVSTKWWLPCGRRMPLLLPLLLLLMLLLLWLLLPLLLLMLVVLLVL